MNRRIRSILGLMTVCMVGIYAFQGYWLWSTYQIYRQQFNRSVQDALTSVLQQRQLSQAQGLLPGRLSPGVLAPAQGPEPDLRSPGPPPRAEPGSRLRRTSNLVLVQKPGGRPVDLGELAYAYWLELEQRGIGARFLLDTLQVDPEPSGQDIDLYQSLIRSDTEDLQQIITTILVRVKPNENRFARASFGTPSFYLVRRMGWLLGVSVVLLLLTTGCFLLMMSTILRQKKLSEIKNDFINNMTHELKTPIATVTAAVEALQHFGALNNPAKTEAYLTISQQNLQRLSDLVDKVLSLATEEKHELGLRPEPVDLNGLVDELLAGHRLKAPKPVVFGVDIPVGTFVTVDRIHFSNALNNLIDNAINYSREEVTVQLTFERMGTGWQLTVADNGIGIAKVYQSAIFDRFFRVPTGDLHPVKGFGLGLAYVRQVIERHGATIALRSELSKGTQFTITFP
ncbi:sensor histidine kinase [Rudanella paleaurantiibacter]|uniref:histidine kinase n=1 Tax=Rudanella paleaurantiibacter TaxID=2614655 RepID=A0A7J5TUF5_9BACT|nr:HAMP domain-containing sensor histidine kinase [Rudanella paleaurantiibacter]KAB7727289.1 sensor histidine kinase [Rudanella paleaurantiibacter]